MAGKREPLVRFSVAIGGELLRRFDRYREQHRYSNRSEAVRGLMRGALLQEAAMDDQATALGVLTLVYDHHASRIAERLTELQHLHLEQIISTTHVHLDAHRCLEVILLRGPARAVRELADSLIGTRGVETGRLVLAAADAHGEHHSHKHAHSHADLHGHDHPCLPVEAPALGPAARASNAVKPRPAGRAGRRGRG